METLQHIECLVSALNDLIRINNDRITGYKKRMDTTLDDDLGDLFAQFIYQSGQNIIYLTKYIYMLGGKPTDGTSLSGKFYHAWIDFKLTVIKQDRQTLLDYCEYSEDVAKSAYSQVLDDKDLTNNDKILIHLLTRQFTDFKISHQQIKTLRDRAAAAA
ncbi:MAG TPA: PA2169 family four-helix-bundle protein [Mucilaginibacter sp.]|nr:PA2169 family four-helix-bundle protein [Mucilaginibacter sp.]